MLSVKVELIFIKTPVAPYANHLQVVFSQIAIHSVNVINRTIPSAICKSALTCQGPKDPRVRARKKSVKSDSAKDRSTGGFVLALLQLTFT